MCGPVAFSGNFVDRTHYELYLRIWQVVADNAKVSGCCCGESSWRGLPLAGSGGRVDIGSEGYLLRRQLSSAKVDTVFTDAVGTSTAEVLAEGGKFSDKSQAVHGVHSVHGSIGADDGDVCHEVAGDGSSHGGSSKQSGSGAFGGCDRSSAGGRRMSSAQKNRKEKARRMRKKQRDVADRDAESSRGGVGSLPVVGVGLPLGRNGKPLKEESVGFWKSCSEATRLKLIESKAQMHISENLRKAKENEDRIEYLSSTQAIVDRVTKLVGKAEEMAKDANDNRVLGWAKTVTSSSAESLAKTVPDSVLSLTSYTSEAVADEVAQAKARMEEEKQVAIAEFKLRAELEQTKRLNEQREALVREREELARVQAMALAAEKKKTEELRLKLGAATGARADTIVAGGVVGSKGKSRTVPVPPREYETPKYTHPSPPVRDVPVRRDGESQPQFMDRVRRFNAIQKSIDPNFDPLNPHVVFDGY